MTDEERVLESISTMLGQSFKEVAKRGGITVKKVREVVKKLDSHGDIEWSKSGDKLRYCTATEWLETAEVSLPLLGRRYRCELSSSNKRGFELTIYDVRAQPKVEDEKEVPEVEEDTSSAHPPKSFKLTKGSMGQTYLF